MNMHKSTQTQKGKKKTSKGNDPDNLLPDYLRKPCFENTSKSISEIFWASDFRFRTV